MKNKIIDDMCFAYYKWQKELGTILIGSPNYSGSYKKSQEYRKEYEKLKRQLLTEPTRPSVEEANTIVEENFKGLNDLIEDADFLQFYKSLISDCMVDFAKHHAPTDQCENEPDWNCPKCGFIYTSKVTSDGHCKNCSEQVTQRSHTPTDQSNTSFSKQWTEEEIEELNLSSRKGHTPTEKDECQFEADTDRTSATICKLCGKEKHEHSHASKLCPDRFSHFKPTEKEQPILSAEEWIRENYPKLLKKYKFGELPSMKTSVLLELMNQFASYKSQTNK